MKTIQATMADAGENIDSVREAVPGEVYLYFDEEGALARVLLIGVEDIEQGEIESGLVADLGMALDAAAHRAWEHN